MARELGERNKMTQQIKQIRKKEGSRKERMKGRKKEGRKEGRKGRKEAGNRQRKEST